MGPLQKEIADYAQATLARIAGPWKTATDLKTWWFSQREKDMRSSFIITSTTDEYRQLYNAFLARGRELSTASYIKNAEAE